MWDKEAFRNRVGSEIIIGLISSITSNALQFELIIKGVDLTIVKKGVVIRKRIRFKTFRNFLSIVALIEHVIVSIKKSPNEHQILRVGANSILNIRGQRNQSSFVEVFELLQNERRWDIQRFHRHTVPDSVFENGVFWHIVQYYCTTVVLSTSQTNEFGVDFMEEGSHVTILYVFVKRLEI
jgi:hypothetical protein